MPDGMKIVAAHLLKSLPRKKRTEEMILCSGNKRI